MNFDAVPKFKPKPYTKPKELGGRLKTRLIVVGAGPVGLALALDLGRRGHQVVIVTAFDFIAAGSKAICFSKQSLDILDRLGVGERAVEKGVIWNVGKVFWGDRDEPVYEFDMLPVKDQKNPGFINIQQYYIEDYLCDEIGKFPNIQIRWGHSVSGVKAGRSGAVLSVETRHGSYEIEAEYVLACDGSRSTVRQEMGLDFEGRVFEDNFLIADVKFTQPRPSERWFWFDPPFNPGETALLHKQPDNVWRLDFQLGWNIDREAAIRPENVEPFVRGMIGDGVKFSEEWYSIYTFQCRRMERFVHGNVIFAGDSAHLVSPFGARGCNSGIADVDNLGWKLDLILRGEGNSALLETYNTERIEGADENILNSTRSTDFMTPKNEISHAFRNAVLELASEFEFARPFINSGRLSTPTPYRQSALSTPDLDDWRGAGVLPGHPVLDAPLTNGSNGWLISETGDQFSYLHFGETPAADIPVTIKQISVETGSLAALRYGAEDGNGYLVRPDQVVAARWKAPTTELIDQAYNRALGAT